MKKSFTYNNFFLLLLLFYGLAAPYNVFARLHDTEIESQNRYGTPVKLNSIITLPLYKQLPELRYKFNDWFIRVAYLKNKTGIISYKKLSASNMWLKNDEIQAILAAETEGYSWRKLKKNKKYTNSIKYQNCLKTATSSWQRSDGAIAYVSGNAAITFVSSEVLQYDIEFQNQTEQNRTKNLQTF